MKDLYVGFGKTAEAHRKGLARPDPAWAAPAGAVADAAGVAGDAAGASAGAVAEDGGDSVSVMCDDMWAEYIAHVDIVQPADEETPAQQTTRLQAEFDEVFPRYMKQSIAVNWAEEFKGRDIPNEKKAVCPVLHLRKLPIGELLSKWRDSNSAPSGQPSPIDPDLHANPTRYNGSDHVRHPLVDCPGGGFKHHCPGDG